MGHRYIWQHEDWPHFYWDGNTLLWRLGQARKAQGQIIAQAELIGLEDHAGFLIEEAFATSAIEGEKLDRNAIRSSVAKRLGLPTAGLPAEQRAVDGLVEMLLDATMDHKKELNAERLHGWQAALFPTGYSGTQKIEVGRWRTGNEPMQVVSGPFGNEKVHYQAPPAIHISKEMEYFLGWWQNTSLQLDGLIRAGIAHFWFVTIHPYDDGNGRIARAICDLALSQDETSPRRLYNLSTQIIKERDAYYNILETSQKGSMDITPWLAWFLDMYTRAIQASESVIEKALTVAKFWQAHRGTDLNERQLKIVKKLLEAEPQGFEGGINNRKYVSITKTSRETAKRDLADLEAKAILSRNEGKGRSISYRLRKSSP